MIGPAPVLTGTRPRISGWVVNKIRVDITSQQRICHSSEAPVCRALRVRALSGLLNDFEADALGNANGDSNYVRLQILTPIGVLNRSV
jgi:hypothetical protein